MGHFHVALLPGDGIGPEVILQARRVLQAVGERFNHSIEMTEALVGQAAIQVEGEAISDDTMELCKRSDAVLFGAVGGFGV
jgi:3-isopropylmalate dehydrogenase